MDNTNKNFLKILVTIGKNILNNINIVYDGTKRSIHIDIVLDKD